MDKQEDKLIHSFKLSEKEELRIRLGEYNGHRYIDQRVYFKSKDGEEYKPSKTALRLPPECCKELATGLSKAVETLSLTVTK